jgi:protein tyrosine/serine phosphatase
MQTVTKFYGVPGLTNFGQVTPNIYRSWQPTPEGFKTYKDSFKGKYILNLCSGSNEEDKKVIKNLIMVPVSFPMHEWEMPDEKTYDNIVRKIFTDDKNTWLIHCREGKNRTSSICGGIRVLQGWSMQDIMEEALSYGYNAMFRAVENTIQRFKDSV